MFPAKRYTPMTIIVAVAVCVQRDDPSFAEHRQTVPFMLRSKRSTVTLLVSVVTPWTVDVVSGLSSKPPHQKVTEVTGG